MNVAQAAQICASIIEKKLEHCKQSATYKHGLIAGVKAMGEHLAEGTATNDWLRHRARVLCGCKKCVGE